MKVTRPSGVTARVAGLAMSCSSAGKPRASPRVRSSASGSARAARTRAARRAEDRLGVGDQVGRVLDDLEGVAQHVLVVVRALVEAARLAELGHQRRRAPRARRGAATPGRGGAGAAIRPSSSAEALAGRVPQPAPPPRGPARRASRIDGEAELLGQARDPQQAHRVVGEAAGAAPAAGGGPRRSPRPPWRSIRAPAPSAGTASALTVRSRRARSSSRLPPWSGREVDRRTAAGRPARARRRRRATGGSASRRAAAARARRGGARRRRRRRRRGRRRRGRSSASRTPPPTAQARGRAAPAGATRARSARSAGGARLTPRGPAGCAAPDRARHLVVDRAARGGELLGRHPLVALGCRAGRPRRPPPPSRPGRGRS